MSPQQPPENNPTECCNDNGTAKSSCQRSDLLSSPAKATVAWGLPALIAALGVVFMAQELARSAWAAWALALLWAGTACVINAIGCRRAHCFTTGPLFVFAAVVFALKAMGFVGIPSGAIWAVVVGVTLCSFGHERLTGRYFSGGAATN